LFLLGGRCLADARGEDRLRAVCELLGALALPLLALALPLVAARIGSQSDSPYLRELLAAAPAVFDPLYLGLACVWLAAALACLLLSWRQRTPLPAIPDSGKDLRVVRLSGRAPVDFRWMVVAPGLVSAFGISLLLLPALTTLQQDPVRAAGRFAATLNVPVVSDDRMPSFSVYLGRPTEVRDIRAGDVAFGRIDHPERLGRRHQVLFAQGGVRVVRVLEP